MPKNVWSALRKVTDIAGIDDLFSKKANLMINIFAIDEKVKRKRYIPITWIHKIKSWCKLNCDEGIQIWLLIMFSMWQNVQGDALSMINFNDIFFNEGLIWLQKIKDHKEPIWTTLHPLAEKAARELQGMYPAHEMKLMGNKPLPYLTR